MNTVSKNLIFSILMFFSALCFSQEFCGTITPPNTSSNLNSLQTEEIRNIKRRISLDNALYTIPVVVHIIHDGSALGSLNNPSDQSIKEMLDNLNKIFSATHPNYASISKGGSDIKIRFELAKRTPDCLPTNGIIRINASNNSNYIINGVDHRNTASGFKYQDLMKLSHWHTFEYFNIYIVHKITNEGVAGFANYPISFDSYPGYESDGAVIESNYLLGTTLAHEVGHWLNLRHTFEGSDGSQCPKNDNCETDGDQVCDTDPHPKTFTGCQNEVNTCTGKVFDNNLSNFMAYSYCPKIFSPQQKLRMREALLSSRSTLLSAKSLLEPTANEELKLSGIITELQFPNEPLCLQSFTKFKVKDLLSLGNSYNFTWKVNGSEKGNDLNLYVWPKANDVINFEITSSNKCLISNTLSLSYTVNNYITKPNFVISTAINQFCIGDSVTYQTSNLVELLGKTVPVKWTVNGSRIESTDSKIKLPITDKKTEIYAAIDKINNCDINDAFNSFQGYVFNEGIYATISDTNNPNKCPLSSKYYIVSTNALSFENTFNWKINGKTMTSYEFATTLYTNNVKNNDLITFEITPNSTCSNAKKVISNTVIAKSKILPPTPIVTVNDNVLTTDLTDIVPGWVWIKSNTQSVFYSNSKTFSPSDPGKYMALIFHDNCALYSDTVFYKIPKPTALNDYEESNSIFELFPNPSHSHIGINVKNHNFEHIDYIKIFSLDGILLFEKQNFLSNELIFHDLEQGTYISEISSENYSSSHKLIIN